MNESIIVGLVVGSGVAVIGAYVGHLLRLREMNQQWDREKQRMEALWAEEERRRKSDRRRELYERDLKIVADAMHRVIEAMTSALRLAEPKLKLELVVEAHGMMLECKTVVDSFGDPELTKGWHELMNNFETWWKEIDLDTATDVELAERAVQTQKAASGTVRRIREILEEV